MMREHNTNNNTNNSDRVTLTWQMRDGSAVHILTVADADAARALIPAANKQIAHLASHSWEPEDVLDGWWVIG